MCYYCPNWTLNDLVDNIFIVKHLKFYLYLTYLSWSNVVKVVCVIMTSVKFVEFLADVNNKLISRI